MKNGKQFFALIVSVLAICVIVVVSLFAVINSNRDEQKNNLINQTDIKKQQSSSADFSQPVAQQSNKTTQITKAAAQAGVLSSAKQIDRVITHLAGNSQYSACLFLPSQRPDESIFSTSLEIPVENAPSIYASVSFAPFPEETSQAVYDTVQYVSKTPEELRTSVFKNIKNERILKSDIMMLDNGSAKFFLMPAGEGCIVIRKEVVR